jgi:hypothetical protein
MNLGKVHFVGLCCIIPLQTTRKENNWKTEEALARANVTVETEGSKGPILDVYDDNDDIVQLH